MQIETGCNTEVPTVADSPKTSPDREDVATTIDTNADYDDDITMTIELLTGYAFLHGYRSAWSLYFLGSNECFWGFQPPKLQRHAFQRDFR